MDDHGSHRYHFDSDRGETSDDEVLSDEDSTSARTVEEVRFGIRDSRDLEANHQQMRREKSTRSIKDPTLVREFPRTILSQKLNHVLGQLGVHQRPPES